MYICINNNNIMNIIIERLRNRLTVSEFSTFISNIIASPVSIEKTMMYKYIQIFRYEILNKNINLDLVNYLLISRSRENEILAIKILENVDIDGNN